MSYIQNERGVWVPVGTLDTASAAITNAAESIVAQWALAANALRLKSRLRLTMTLWKSGVTDTGLVRVRMGVLGTIADGSIYSATMASAANRQTGVVFDWRIESATTVQQLPGGTGGAGGYSVSAATAGPAASTIANINTAMFFSIGILSGGATDTVVLEDAQLDLRY